MNTTFQFKSLSVRKTSGGRLVIEIAEPNKLNKMYLSKADAIRLSDEIIKIANK